MKRSHQNNRPSSSGDSGGGEILLLLLLIGVGIVVLKALLPLIITLVAIALACAAVGGVVWLIYTYHKQIWQYLLLPPLRLVRAILLLPFVLAGKALGRRHNRSRSGGQNKSSRTGRFFRRGATSSHYTGGHQQNAAGGGNWDYIEN